MSPFRSLVKNPMGSDTILSYICRRMSLTTPFCKGMVKNSLRYAVITFSRQVTTRRIPKNPRVKEAP